MGCGTNKRKHQSIYFGIDEWEEVKAEADRLDVSASEILRRCWEKYNWNIKQQPNRKWLRMAMKHGGL